MAFTYMLRCADGSYYVGSTYSLELRLHQHQIGEERRTPGPAFPLSSSGSRSTRTSAPRSTARSRSNDGAGSNARRSSGGTTPACPRWPRRSSEPVVSIRSLALATRPTIRVSVVDQPSRGIRSRWSSSRREGRATAYRDRLRGGLDTLAGARYSTNDRLPLSSLALAPPRHPIKR
ncbi:MAG TPA: GIY-YIG nuclease family protein [Marmoricola sp.]